MNNKVKHHFPRLVWLDVNRGLTVFFMLLINLGGNNNQSFLQLTHTKLGFHFADWVYPNFIFIMGIALGYNKSNLKLKRIIQRGISLFIIGIIIENFPFYFPLGGLRLMGILQRIAILYTLGGCLLLLNYRYLIISCLASFILFILIYSFNYSTLNQAPFRFQEAIDQLVLRNHIYRGMLYDPQGILSLFGSLINAFIGILIGVLLHRFHLTKFPDWTIIFSIVFSSAGFFLSFIFPLSQDLWLPSFSLFTIGLSLFFGQLIQRITIIHYPILLFWGQNALLLYLISEVIRRISFYYFIDNTPLRYTSIDWLSKHSFLSIHFAALVSSLVLLALTTLVVKVAIRYNVKLR
ncbi:heparan-alpha-glucosaminide N-acetyltransferase domain-containing protein [Flammeovirga sp. OC4]|uniref:heparan-alpha-glucosaminide N-acetyltransferase domain-containing protein n=1 Tax=Flammeovirga sp. OC4 TaxID=1382345 RepID=UPI0005C5628B|nr:heparan-alpha-glucosaminide N-acetyltransferase domain-containing protein [Flammeovirga sp. OC4]